MFDGLERLNTRPRSFEFYTASELWTGGHTAERMLAFHLNDEVDISSRNSKFINDSVEWIYSRFNIGIGMKIADFGCGPEVYSERLAQWKAEVTGIDFSPRSAKYARETSMKKGSP